MDFQFPQQLFPSYYSNGPPDSTLTHSAGTWGSYHAVRVQGDSGPLSSRTFYPKYEVTGEKWRPTEPSPIPLLSPKHNFVWPVTPPDPLNFTEHLQNFFMDYNHDAFGCMSEILGENFNFSLGRVQPHRKGSISMWKLRNFLDLLKYKACQLTYHSRTMNRYSMLLWDVIPSIPVSVLGSLVHQELTDQRDRMLFCEEATGGALAFIPSSQSGHGFLLYPANQGLDLLKFHKVELQHNRENHSTVDTRSSKPYSFQLKYPIRQLNVKSRFNQSCVGVRSDHHCGLWRVVEDEEPRLLQVIKTSEMATCISVSPHVLGEVLVASEGGAAKLWTVGKGIQEVRTELTNLYFNAKSSWRWCEFSAHPRVMLYADRTGAELTDMRVRPASGHTLFCIGSTTECRSGERLIQARYLEDAHPFHHLITTQYSAYIMDERFPTLPMLKWDHMMESPPVFCHIIPGEGRSTKILLGSHRTQEITLLQYSGGRSQACSSLGPPQSFLRARDSLKHLPVQIPHRLENATNRLSAPASGVTCIQVAGGSAEECLGVFQLTEAGDIFYQILELQNSDSPPRSAAQSARKQCLLRAEETFPMASQPLINNVSSDEDLVAPTQAPNLKTFVAETPEREQPVQPVDYSSFSEDSDGEERRGNLKQLNLPVLINIDPDEDVESDAGNEGGDKVTEERVHLAEDVCEPSILSSAAPPQRPTLVKLSDAAVVTWKLWLRKVARKRVRKKSTSQYFSVPTKGLLKLSDGRETAESDSIQQQKEALRLCMQSRSLLANSTLPGSFTPSHEVPLPDQVDTAAWTDQLSQRLTLSWQGEEAWRAWWEEETGVHTEAKQQALKRKRRMQKQARRAAGLQVELSSSFSSSGFPSEADSDFSEWSGRSSASSHLNFSNFEVTAELSGLSEILALEAAEDPTSVSEVDAGVSDSAFNTQTKDREPSTTSRTRSQLLFPVQTPPPTAAAAASSPQKRQPSDNLPATADGQLLKDVKTLQRRPPPHPSITPSQLSQSSQFSQFSQLSQSRLGTSQSSQPRKKKSRMGF